MYISKVISKVIGDKKAWRKYKDRARQLPPVYRAAVDGFERYLMFLGGSDDGTAMYSDLIELFEQAASDQTPLRQVVGEDPVDFIETFMRNYPSGAWIIRERQRLVQAIAAATKEDASSASVGSAR